MICLLQNILEWQNEVAIEGVLAEPMHVMTEVRDTTVCR